MKKIFILISLLWGYTLIHAQENLKNTIGKQSLVGLYEPTKRECPKLKIYNKYCEESISQFEIVKGGVYADFDDTKFGFIVWVTRFIKSDKLVDKLNLTVNGEYIIALSDDNIKPNQTIILEEMKEEDFIAKIEFLDFHRGIYTLKYKNSLTTIHFKRISKEEDKYSRYYREKE